ncbi:hypothetical protein SAMN04487936_103300 [Halobacillus dabanensis]|uniref:Uncharacterized protein n=1 Tax=Halobacillus dabanensis TaxID=240302 RepID=A0A1I3TDW5_HALDA|nr:hypothetical protein [Halobacillus dabanensis]SFJ67876.1 hypothetical protein SAMN04487936_103300 [Halobacillus dabanensis]
MREPFNDVIDHKQTVEGYPTGRRRKLPIKVRSFIPMLSIGLIGNMFL